MLCFPFAKSEPPATIVAALMDGRGPTLPESSEKARRLVGEQDFDSRRADGGGTTEEMDRNEVDEVDETRWTRRAEMDRDGADDGGGGPCWSEMARNQKGKWKRRVTR